MVFNAGTTSVRFKRAGDFIETPAISFDGRVRPVFAAGSFEVWHKESGKGWGGNGMAGYRPTVPAEFWLVRIEGDRAHWIECVKHGRDRSVKARLIAEAKRQAGDTETGGDA